MTMLRSFRQKRARRRWRKVVAAVALLLITAALLFTNATALHLFGRVPIRIYPARSPAQSVAAVMVSGDMGFEYGMSRYFTRALQDRGVTVVGVSAPVIFAHHRSLAEAQATVEYAMKRAMQLTGAKRLILVGQSYGADIVATVAPRLPPDLMRHVGVVDLMVPGRYVYFRADLSGIAYLGQPDAQPAAALARMHRPPVICIYGLKEEDSLCPLITSSAKVIGLPGGHYLNHDSDLLIRTALGALKPHVPALRP